MFKEIHYFCCVESKGNESTDFPKMDITIFGTKVKVAERGETVFEELT